MSVTKEEILKDAADFFNYSIEKLDDKSGISRIPGWDSLGHVAFAMKIEEKYNVTINEKNIGEVLTIADIVKFVNDETS